jgi:hypothetical protein
MTIKRSWNTKINIGEQIRISLSCAQIKASQHALPIERDNKDIKK